MRSFYFAYFANIGIVVPYFSLYYESLGCTPFQIGVLASILPLARPFFAGVWTLPADRLGLRRAATLVTCWLTAGAFALYFVPTGFAGLVAATIAVAAAHAPTLSLGEATILDVARERGIPYGRLRVWGSIGFIASSAAYGFVLGRLPIRTALWAALAFAAMLAAAAHLLPRPRDLRPASPSSLRGFLARPGVLAFYGASMLMQASHGAYYTFFSIHMAAQGHPGAVIGGLWSLGVVAEVVVMIGSARVLKASSPSSLLTACFLLAAARWGLYAASASIWIAIPAQILHAASFAVFHIAGVTATHRIFPDDLRASGQAVYSSVTYGIGTVLGSITAGALYGAVGPFRLFAVCALIALAGAVLIGRATRRIEGFDAAA